MTGEGDGYTCANCGGAFTKGWSDEEAMSEARAGFSEAELAATAVICDACYNLMMPELARLRAELDQEAAAAGMSYEAFMRREADQ